MKRHSIGDTILLAAMFGVLGVVNFVWANLHIVLFLVVCVVVCVALSRVGRQHPRQEREEGEDR